MKTVDSDNLGEICAELASRDDRLGFVVGNFGTPPLWERAPNFATLVHIILEQQVSLASARAAFTKLEERIEVVTPAALLELTDDELKACYFSRQKSNYARGLASAVASGKLDLEEIATLPDAEVRLELKKLKGIGDWTADIFLLMALRRADVMPRGDLALHVACGRLYEMEQRPSADEFLEFAARWRPYRAVAARILWHFYLSAPRPKSATKLSREVI